MTVLLVAGPPCSGKTTYARERAMPGDEVLDFDVLYAEITGLELYARDYRAGAEVEAAFRARLTQLSRGFLIRCAPLKQHRAVLRKLRGATSVVLAVPAEVCHARLRASDRPASSLRGLHLAIDDWWDQYEPSSSADETVIGEEWTR